MENDQDNQPVAYDVDGRPLYSHPLNNVNTNQPVDNIKHESDDVMNLKHERSQAAFPNLDLSKGEYVIKVVERHPIGIFSVFAIGFIIALVLITVLADIKYIAYWMQIDLTPSTYTLISTVIISMLAITAVVVYMANYIYRSNKMFLTNESVIQEIRVGFFTRHEQIVSLGNIKDVSFSREGILQQLCNCGTVRLTTEGEDTNYCLSFVKDPHDSVVTINNTIEDFCKVNPISD